MQHPIVLSIREQLFSIVRCICIPYSILRTRMVFARDNRICLSSFPANSYQVNQQKICTLFRLVFVYCDHSEFGCLNWMSSYNLKNCATGHV